jgi:hippurate hydrolase
MKTVIAEIFPYYQALRHRIHAHPELRYEEEVTAQLVATELEKLGLEVQTQIGKTGVVGILDTHKPGKTVALRADMDALPIVEETSLPYQSNNVGKMHACGHDGHTASLLATAHVLSQMKDKLVGKVKFIFQPAEEGGAGAKAMIEDGVLTNPDVDAIFAFHNSPGLPLGTIMARDGCTMYGNCELSITVHGKGGHAAQPERVINPITVASKMILGVNDILNQLMQDNDPTVIAITKIQCGNATNVVADEAYVSGTIRAANQDKFREAKDALRQLFQVIEKEYQAKIEFRFDDKYPPTINTPKEAEFVLKQAKSLFGEDKVRYKSTLTRASEDFSYFLQQIPGCYFFIGNGENSPSCHNAHYNFADEIIPVACELLSHLTIKYLNEGMV